MIEAMKLALEALKELVAQTENSFFSIKHDHVALQNSRSAIAKLNQAIEQVEKLEVPYVLVERDGSGKTVISSISPEALGHVKQYPKCNPHPKAPHGFDRNASHGLDRHVCECESWDAYDAGIEEGMKRERALWEMAENARELGLDYEPVQEPWVWQQAPIKTQWGHDMVVADLAIDKDHTVSVYCERDQTARVEAVFRGKKP